MSDYEELIKNLRSVKDTWQTQEEEWMLQAADAIEKLKALTAADAKPVVLCKDCKHYNDGWCYNPNTYDDEKTRGNTVPDWYCADGERREANDEQRISNNNVCTCDVLSRC